jgi:hypothetical protein
MQEIATSDGRTFWLLQQPEPIPLAVRFGGRDFACLIWDSGGERTVEQRHLVVAALIEAGCRYFVCGGEDPLAWEEAADEEIVMMTLNASEAEVEERMVMTTAHKAESEEDVVFFFVSCTNFTAHGFSNFLVLTVGCDGGAVARLCSAVRAIISAKT